jgi:pyridoxine 5-phosphate synthase
VKTLLNLEMACTEEMLAIAIATRPEIVTLVPEKREERTTEGGLDLERHKASLGAGIARLGDAGIAVSLFIDPEARLVQAARELGAPRIELHTGDYAHARGAAAARELGRLAQSAELGTSLGLHVAAGHGLDEHDVGAVAAIASVTELDIGHSMVAHALHVGLDRAVRDMLAQVAAARA